MEFKKNCPNCKREFLTKNNRKIFCCRECFCFQFNCSNCGKKIKKTKYNLCLKCFRNSIHHPRRNAKLTQETKDKISKKLLGTKQSNETKEKRIISMKKTFQDKYGVDCVYQTKEFIRKSQQTKLEKYANKNYNNNKQSIETKFNRRKEIILEGLFLRNIKLLESWEGKKKSHYNFQCLNCNYVFTSTIINNGRIPICRKCYPCLRNSDLENELESFFQKNDIEYKRGDRTIIKPFEVDFYLQKYNLAIELNGNYYHSENHGGTSKLYHLNKTQKCFEKNIKLIHIFENEMFYKKDIVLSRIKNCLNLISKENIIYARKCELRVVSNENKIKFLNDNHIQGNCSDSIRVGLYFKNELYAIMTMGFRNIINKLELIRFCNKIDCRVIGGFSKLLKFIQKEYKFNEIISYADICWTGLDYENTVYSKNGFKFVSKSPPNYFYLKSGDWLNPINRMNFQKKSLIKENPELQDSTEWEIMQSKGYDRIWRCGSLKFIKN